VLILVCRKNTVNKCLVDHTPQSNYWQLAQTLISCRWCKLLDILVLWIVKLPGYIKENTIIDPSFLAILGPVIDVRKKTHSGSGNNQL